MKAHDKAADKALEFASITNIAITFMKPDYTQLKHILGDRQLHLPDPRFMVDHLCSATLTCIINNAYPAIGNALRRVVIDEMLNYKMYVKPFDNILQEIFIDPFCTVEFVINRIQQIPIRRELINPKIEFTLDVSNNTPVVKYIYAGDIEILSNVPYKRGKEGAPGEYIYNDTGKHKKTDGSALPFDPRYEIAVLQPGKKIKIPKIVINQDMGHKKGTYQFGVRCLMITQDIEEYPRELTHARDAEFCDTSGYKQLCSIANPMRHMLQLTFTQIEANDKIITGIIVEACSVIIERILNISTVVSVVQTKFKSDIQINYAEGDVIVTQTQQMQQDSDMYYELIVNIKNETSTIIELIGAEIHYVNPDILYCTQDVRTSDSIVHLRSIELPVQIFANACSSLISTFGKIKQVFES